MMVVFLCGLVALILMRTLRADYARYMRDEEGDAETGGSSDKGECVAAPSSRRNRSC